MPGGGYLYRSKERPWVGATPDAVAYLEGEVYGVEAKTARGRFADKWGEPGSDAIPTEYLIQTQTQMYVLDLERVDVPVLIDGADFRIYTVSRNDSLIRVILERLDTLWDRVQRRDPPAPDWERDAELILQTQKATPGRVISLTEQAAEDWADAVQLGKTISNLQAERETLRAKVVAAMGDAETATLPGDLRQIRRKQITKKPYTVTPKPYWDLREVGIKTNQEG